MINMRLILLTVLLSLIALEPCDGCTCGPQHPQMSFCYSDVVIRGKIVSAKRVSLTNNTDSFGDWLQYGVKQRKMLKGFELIQDVQFLYTPPESSLCGFEHDPNSTREEFVISGQLVDGRVMVTSCSFIELWNTLTSAQKKGLMYTYKTGCDCNIIPCHSLPCSVNSDNECLWTDGLLNRSWRDNQARNFACVHNGSGTCTWEYQKPRGFPNSMKAKFH